ncbi:BRF1-domain-containing protein, partial [Flagelloscypha sp. PMI_526]
PTCTSCSGTTIEYSASAGNSVCTRCGTVVEENAIISEITFGETSAGAAVVQGAFVGQGAIGHHGGLGSSGATNESRELTIAKASQKIQSIATLMRLPNTVVLAATRLYTLAVEHKFTRWKKEYECRSRLSLYRSVGRRKPGTRSWMLIDFSDLLQVNVFELGHTFLNLMQTLHLHLKTVDPSHYISRFAALLEFGDATNRVAQDATRIVSRFDRDWMTKGRRPAGICGAALFLAARMNGFNRSVEEIVQIVKIADTTLKKRLDEFKNTPSGQLSVADFRNVWLDEECNPPAFLRAREAEIEAEESDEDDGLPSIFAHSSLAHICQKKAKISTMKMVERRRKKKGRKKKEKTKKRKTKKRKRDLTDISGEESTRMAPLPRTKGLDPELFKQGILAGVLDLDPNHQFVPPVSIVPDRQHIAGSSVEPIVVVPEQPEAGPSNPPPSPKTLMHEQAFDLMDERPLLRQPVSPARDKTTEFYASSSLALQNAAELSNAAEVEASLTATLQEDISSVLASEKGVQLSEVLAQKDRERLEGIQMKREAAIAAATNKWKGKGRAMDVDEEEGEATCTDAPTVHVDGFEDIDPLLDLDEAELDWFLLSEEEVKVKERVWVEMNKDYLEALALKGDQESNKKPRKRRKAPKARDASTPSGSTAVESVKKMMKKNPKYSKRINYDVLKDLLDSGNAARLGTPFPGLPNLEDKDDDDLFFMTPDRTPAPTSDNEKDTPIMIIEENEPAPPAPTQNTKAVEAEDSEVEDDDDDLTDLVRREVGWEGEQREVGWEDDGFEQEV